MYTCINICGYTHVHIYVQISLYTCTESKDFPYSLLPFISIVHRFRQVF